MSPAINGNNKSKDKSLSDISVLKDKKETIIQTVAKSQKTCKMSRYLLCFFPKKHRRWYSKQHSCSFRIVSGQHIVKMSFAQNVDAY